MLYTHQHFRTALWIVYMCTVQEQTWWIQDYWRRFAYGRWRSSCDGERSRRELKHLSRCIPGHVDRDKAHSSQTRALSKNWMFGRRHDTFLQSLFDQVVRRYRLSAGKCLLFEVILVLCRFSAVIMDSDNVEHFLKRLTVSEDAVAYQQAEEDLRLYFSRLVSSTCPIIGMWTMHPVLPLPSPKQTLSGCEDNGRRNEISKTNGFEISSHQSVVTATD